MKHFSLTCIFALALAFFFVACGDNESSFAPRDEDSSSSVCEDCDDASSSSVRSSSSAEPALSSAEGGEDLSSSSETSVSSSSAKSSSSVTPKSSSSEKSSSSAKSSSSSAKSSSSSAKSSSSFVKGDYTNPSLSYGEFEDVRNHRTYKYLTIAGKNKNDENDTVTVMAENLNVGDMVDGSMDQSDDEKIERYCYNNDTAICLTYGGLYQWAETMQLPSECNTKSCADQIQPNHQGICPDGWRLLTYDDFYIVVHADRNKNGVEDVRATYFGGYNYSGYSLIGAGYNWNYKFKNLNEATCWFYPEESAENTDVATYSTNQNKQSSGFSRNEVYKTHGFSVRCVKLD